MNKAQAIAKLRKLLGSKFAYRELPSALAGEARETARSEFAAKRTARDEAKQALEARRTELLKDPEYVQLMTEYQSARNAADKLQSNLLQHRVTVGTAGGMFFSVVADGDNWTEVVEKVEAKSKVAETA